MGIRLGTRVVRTGLVHTFDPALESKSTGYITHVFTGNGTFTPSKSMEVEYMIIGGGGGGGSFGGGGGAGGVVFGKTYVTNGTAYSIVVGAGGAGQDGYGTTTSAYFGTTGSNSSAFGVTAYGGGGGGSRRASPYYGSPGLTGGSGGGGSHTNVYHNDTDHITGGTGTAGQGRPGGNGKVGTDWGSPNHQGGGGGGAGERGGDATGNITTGSYGGDGVQSGISGNLSYYGGGGGGMGYSGQSSVSPGGLGGGGQGSMYSTNINARDGAAATGGGGGSGNVDWGGNGDLGINLSISGDGGSGAVVIRYMAQRSYATGGTIKPFVGNGGVWGETPSWDAGAFPVSREDNVYQNFPQNRSVWLDGVNDRVNLGWPDEIAALAGTSEITVEAWVKYDAYTGSNGAQTYSVISNSGNPWIWLLENPSNKIRFRTSTGGSDTSLVAPTTHELDRWYQVVGTYDGHRRMLYIDGVNVAGDNPTGTLGSGSGAWTHLGTFQGTNYNLDGQIGVHRLYNRALSPEEVLQNYNATKNIYHVIGTKNNPANHSGQILKEFPNAPDGIYWFELGYGPIPVYCDMTNGGWMMVASNNAADTTIPGGTSRNNVAYRLDRNGTTSVLGTADPDADYIMGASINNLIFNSVRIYGWGRGSTNGTYDWGTPSYYGKTVSTGNQGTYLTVEWPLTTEGDARFTEIVPRANVTFGGNAVVHASANYFILDAVRMDVSLNANSNQSTVGAAGVANANGDPSNGTLIGHGTSEGSYEGWYDASSHGDAQGYTTWVK